MYEALRDIQIDPPDVVEMMRLRASDPGITTAFTTGITTAFTTGNYCRRTAAGGQNNTNRLAGCGQDDASACV